VGGIFKSCENARQGISFQKVGVNYVCSGAKPLEAKLGRNNGGLDKHSSFLVIGIKAEWPSRAEKKAYQPRPRWCVLLPKRNR
jgi:hypothetical protein